MFDRLSPRSPNTLERTMSDEVAQAKSRTETATQAVQNYNQWVADHISNQEFIAESRAEQAAHEEALAAKQAERARKRAETLAMMNQHE